jgi:uncharacterized membrane protein HdeD (DUF308 family)
LSTPGHEGLEGTVAAAIVAGGGTEEKIVSEDITPSQEFYAGGAGGAIAQGAKRLWWLALLTGVVSVLVGILLLAWPGKTLLVLMVVLGIYLLVFGVLRFIEAVFDTEMDQRGLNVFLGILAVVLGVLVMREPVRFVWVAAIVVGLFWLIRGLIEIFRSIARHDVPDRGWRLSAGLISIVAGAVILLWPGASVLVVAVISGIYLMVIGIIEVVVAFKLRSA